MTGSKYPNLHGIARKSMLLQVNFPHRLFLSFASSIIFPFAYIFYIPCLSFAIHNMKYIKILREIGMEGKSFKNTFIFIIKKKKGRHFSPFVFFPFFCRFSCKKFPAGDGLGFAFIFISKNKKGNNRAEFFFLHHASDTKNNKTFQEENGLK